MEKPILHVMRQLEHLGNLFEYLQSLSGIYQRVLLVAGVLITIFTDASYLHYCANETVWRFPRMTTLLRSGDGCGIPINAKCASAIR